MIDQLDELGTIDEVAAKRVAHAARARVGALEAPIERRRSIGRSRAALAGLLAVVAAGAILITVHPWGGGRAEAAVLRRALLAVTPPPHTIQHIVSVLHQGALVLTTESWQSIDQPGSDRWRGTSSACGNWVTEESETLNERQWFDPDHNRVLAMRLDPARVRASWPVFGPRTQFDPSVMFATALRDGDAHVVDHTTIDGIPVTQISWPEDPAADPNGQARNSLFVNTATGAPVAYAWGGGKLDGTGGIVAQVRFPTYEFMPQTPKSEALLSEKASHPQAATAPISSEREFGYAYQDAQRAHCSGVG